MSKAPISKEPTWRRVKFGDVVRDVKESEHNPADVGLSKFVAIEHIEPNEMFVKEYGCLSTESVSFTKRFRKGQVLFVKRRAYQRKVAIAKCDGICSSDILTLEPLGKDLLPDLLPFIVQSDEFFEHALNTSSGSLSPRTRWSQLKSFEFDLPSLAKQKEISPLLLAVVEARQRFMNARDDAIACRESFLRFGFVGLTHGSKQLPKTHDIKRIELPKDWRLQPASKLCAEPCTRGYTPSDHLTPDEGDVPFLKVYNLTFDGELDFSVKPFFLSREAHENVLKRSQVKPSDVLMNLTGPPMGKISRIPKEFPEGNINQAIVRFRPKNELLSKYLTLYLRSQWAQSWLFRRSKKTSGQRNLTLALSEKLPVPVGPSGEMEDIVASGERIDTAVSRVENLVETYLDLRRTLVRKLLNAETKNGTRPNPIGEGGGA